MLFINKSQSATLVTAKYISQINPER